MRPSRLSPGTHSFPPLHSRHFTYNIETWTARTSLRRDDSQVYGFCRPNSTDVQHLRSVSTSGISDIADWMKCNRLQLNSSKSEFICVPPHVQGKSLDCNSFVIGVILYRDLSMTLHITGLVRTNFATLRQLRYVSRSLTQDATRHQCKQSLILSRIDYCNVAFVDLPQRSIILLQAVINAAARLVGLLRFKKCGHISTLMRDELQWLRIGERIRFKLSILVHKCLNNSASPYLVDKIRPLSEDCNMSRLRSSHSSDVFAPGTRLKWAIRPFRSLVHVLGTVFLQLFGKAKHFLF